MSEPVESPESSRVQPPTDRISGRSIAAFVLGLICLCLGPLGVLPIVVGTLALARPQARCENHGRGLATAGIVMGVFGVLGTFVWWIVINQFLMDAQFRGAQSFAHVQSQALIVYAEYNDEQFPTAAQWPDVLVEHGIIEQTQLIPYIDDGDEISYIYRPGQTPGAENEILIYEDPKHWKQGVIVGFADGHVELIDHETFERMLAEQLAAQSESP